MAQSSVAALPADLGSLLAVHSFAAVILLGLAALLYRTASGTLYSRFLRHLAASVGLNVLFRIGSVVDLVAQTGAAFLKPKAVAGESLAALAIGALEKLHATWHVADSLISLLASFFLFAAWDILRRYPREGVDRSFYTGLTVAFGVAALAAVADFIQVVDSPFVRGNLGVLLEGGDILAATVGLFLVGLALSRTLGPRIASKNPIVLSALPHATFLLYVFWAGLQPLYPWLGGSAWYDVAILAAGVASILITLLLCALTLEDKPEYDTQPALRTHPPVSAI